MDPLALELNEKIARNNPHTFESMSRLGKALFFPKAILHQAGEAKQKARAFDATAGIATEGKGPMYLKTIHRKLSAFSPKDLYLYAPPAGKPELRQAWRAKLLEENPSLADKNFGLPIATNALTHGLSIVADLFCDEGDVIISPDKFYENYSLTYEVKYGCEIVTFPLFDESRRFNHEGLRGSLLGQRGKGKAIVLLNFPNNPTGYTPTVGEAQDIVRVIREVAEAGMNIVAVMDDAYYGLFFEECLTESLFGMLAGIHPRVLAIKVDGATKEDFVWGFRVGFITYASQSNELLDALEKKTMGSIRATISNGPHPSQTFILEAMRDPGFKDEVREKLDILKRRALRVKEILLDTPKYGEAWDYYPFNSGYFMCLRLKHVKAEALRVHLLDKYGVGTISLGDTDLRIAFSSVEEGSLGDMFELIYSAACDLGGRPV